VLRPSDTDRMAALEAAVRSLQEQPRPSRKQVRRTTTVTNNVTEADPSFGFVVIAPVVLLTTDPEPVTPTTATTLDVSAYVPEGTAWVLLDAYARDTGANNDDVELNVRADSSGHWWRVLKFRSVATEYSGQQASQVLCPVSDGLTIDYQVTLSGFANLELRLIAYHP